MCPFLKGPLVQCLFSSDPVNSSGRCGAVCGPRHRRAVIWSSLRWNRIAVHRACRCLTCSSGRLCIFPCLKAPEGPWYPSLEAPNAGSLHRWVSLLGSFVSGRETALGGVWGAGWGLNSLRRYSCQPLSSVSLWALVWGGILISL